MQNTASRILQHVLKRRKTGGLFVSAEKENGRRKCELGVVVRFNQCKNMQNMSGCFCYYSILLYAGIKLLRVGDKMEPRLIGAALIKVRCIIKTHLRRLISQAVTVLCWKSANLR